MANVRATKSGNWSDTTVWNTGALPTSSDDVYSNTYTVTIDQDVTVLSLRNTSATSITQGGGFACSTARTVNCSAGTGFVCATGTLLSATNGAGVTLTLLGAMTATAGSALSVAGAGTISLTGAVSSSSTVGVIVTAAGGANSTLNITGDVSCSAQQGITISQAITLNITGNITVTGAAANRSAVFINSAAATVVVTGSVSGSTGGANQYGLSVEGSPTHSVTVTGTLTANSSPAIGGSAGAQANTTWTISGPLICNASGLLPFGTQNTGVFKLAAITNNEFRFKSSGTGTASLWSSDVNTGAPTAANVRYGTRYGTSNEFTGTCQVPAAASVLYGVPVDATTGTAAIISDPQLSPL